MESISIFEINNLNNFELIDDLNNKDIIMFTKIKIE